MNSPNRYGEANVKPAKGKIEDALFSEDEYGMKREESADDPDWSHDPRSESSHEKHHTLVPQVKKADVEITEGLSLALYLNPDINGSEITVHFSSGVVTLSGFVHTRGEKMEAERTVEKMKSVEDVLNQLQIRSKAC